MTDIEERRPTFLIDGSEYPLPEMATVTLDEAITIYNYSSLTIDQLEDVEGLHPGVIAALMHISIARQDPSLKPSAVKKLVQNSNLFDVLKNLEEQEAETSPPSQTPESGDSSSGSGRSSGDASTAASEAPLGLGEPQPPTGTPVSDTGAISGRLTSVA